jgi:hypothetical protein
VACAKALEIQGQTRISLEVHKKANFCNVYLEGGHNLVHDYLQLSIYDCIKDWRFEVSSAHDGSHLWSLIFPLIVLHRWNNAVSARLIWGLCGGFVLAKCDTRTVLHWDPRITSTPHASESLIRAFITLVVSNQSTDSLCTSQYVTTALVRSELQILV